MLKLTLWSVWICVRYPNAVNNDYYDGDVVAATRKEAIMALVNAERINTRIIRETSAVAQKQVIFGGGK